MSEAVTHRKVDVSASCVDSPGIDFGRLHEAFGRISDDARIALGNAREHARVVAHLHDIAKLCGWGHHEVGSLDEDGDWYFGEYVWAEGTDEDLDELLYRL